MSQSEPTVQDRFKLQSVAFFGRTLGEYLQMFGLNLESLRGRKILDVASGPGSFVAEALAMGLDATGCDPMYAQDAATITAQGKRDIDACREQIRRNPGVWSTGASRRSTPRNTPPWRDSRQTIGTGAARAGALPELPFADGAFDLVLSANFLMVYAPLADGGMHDGNEFELAPTDYDDSCQGGGRDGGRVDGVLVARRR